MEEGRRKREGKEGGFRNVEEGKEDPEEGGDEERKVLLQPTHSHFHSAASTELA